MKNTLLLLSLTLFILRMNAQNTEPLDLIRTVGNTVNTIEADLSNVKVKNGITTTQEGTLYFVAPNDMAAVFTTGKFMIINKKKLSLDIGVLHGTYRLRESGFAKSMSIVFLYAFQGKCKDLAQETEYSISITSDTNFHYVTLTSKKKHILGLGYRQVVLKYNTDDYHIKEIVLTDFKGTVDTYSLSNIKYNVTVDKNRFQL